MQDSAPDSDSYGIAAGELRQFIERFERLEADDWSLAKLGRQPAPRQADAEAWCALVDTLLFRSIRIIRVLGRSTVTSPGTSRLVFISQF